MDRKKRQAAWRAGSDERVRGKPETACILPRGTIFFDDWQDGWQNADNRLRLATPA